MNILLLACTVAAAITASPEGAQLPRVLIIGDSISIGYTPPLIELLKSEAEVVHNPGNAQHTGNGLKKLDEWLGEEKWDVIHFNFGLHDLKYVDGEGKNAKSIATGHIQIPVDMYEKNLDAIVERLKRTGAKLIFATTTAFPKELKGAVRNIADLPAYNEAALRVMKKHNVAINDLYTFTSTRLAELQHPNDVHFTEAGSAALAGETATAIRAALDLSATRDRVKTSRRSDRQRNIDIENRALIHSSSALPFHPE